MNRLSNFGDFALTRAEMKRVAGGSQSIGCRYWYEIAGQGRLYSSYWLNESNAQKAASNIHTANGGSAQRSGWCCEHCPKKMPVHPW